MSNCEIYIEVEHSEIRAATVADGRLFDFDIERDNRFLGNIYKGRIVNVLPGMDAAFIDIGQEKNALLYVGDLEFADRFSTERAPSIEEILKPNQWLIVQIARPAVGTKGARVTQRFSLPGRFIVLMTGSDNVGVSRRIENADERERLRRIIERVRPLDHGIIVRTEAEGASESDLVQDVRQLHEQLNDIRERGQKVEKPTLLHREMGLLGRIARDRLGAHVNRVLINSPEEFAALRDLVKTTAPQFEDRIQLYDDPAPIFDKFGVSKDIKQICERVVQLHSGGFLTIDEAEALTAIDVNTGRFIGRKRLADTVLKTNLEAAAEAARQLRLRNIGGVIVIDFIDMDNTRDRVKVMAALENALRDDRTRTRIVQLSPLGLVEMTRRREGDSLRQMLFQPCPYCDGEGVIQTPATVAIEARRQIRQVAARWNAELENDDRAILVTTHPQSALSLLDGGDALRALETTIGAPIYLRVQTRAHSEHFAVQSVNNKDMAAQRASSEIQSGARLHLPDNMTLWNEGAAHFAAVNGTLVELDNWNENDAKPATIEVSEANRWMAKARVLTSHQRAS
jgi:ribonuclease G